jgi:hypothetical protein
VDWAQIEAEARVLLDDTVEEYRHTSDELRGYGNNGVAEVCLRLRCLQDASSDICALDYAEDDRTVTLDASILAVRRARLDGQRDPLRLTNARWLDKHYPGWDDDALTSAGRPEACIFDYGARTLTFNCPVSADGTVMLSVWRLPREDELLEGDDDEPVCPEHTHRALKHWIAHEALAQKDGEKGDAERSQLELNKFEALVGPRPTFAAIQAWSVMKERKIPAHFD